MRVFPSFPRLAEVPVAVLGLAAALWCVHPVDAYEVNPVFSQQAGPGDTAYNIASGLLEIHPPLTDPVGWVYVTYTLTDTDGDGATLTGLGPNGGAFLAQYNGWAGDPFGGPQGTTFAECIFSMEAGPYETLTETCAVPPTAIEDPVEDMSWLASFELSANDIVAVSGTYAIVGCFGDLDDDGEIGLSDLAGLLANYGETSGVGYHSGDLNGDGDVDLADLAELLEHYGDACE